MITNSNRTNVNMGPLNRKIFLRAWYRFGHLLQVFFTLVEVLLSFSTCWSHSSGWRWTVACPITACTGCRTQCWSSWDFFHCFKWLSPEISESSRWLTVLASHRNPCRRSRPWIRSSCPLSSGRCWFDLNIDQCYIWGDDFWSYRGKDFFPSINQTWTLISSSFTKFKPSCLFIGRINRVQWTVHGFPWIEPNIKSLASRPSRKSRRVKEI